MAQPVIDIPVEYDDESEEAYRYVESQLAEVLVILDRWHDSNHGIGQRRHCHEQLCRDITTHLAPVS